MEFSCARGSGGRGCDAQVIHFEIKDLPVDVVLLLDSATPIDRLLATTSRIPLHTTWGVHAHGGGGRGGGLEITGFLAGT